jgi:hypothetical protein
MLYATSGDKEPTYVGKNVAAKDLSGHGKLGIGGDGMQGMIGELSIWNSDITAAQLYETRRMARASYTPGLVGYWNMAEGHGTKITDVARSRHMYMPSESWYINNENLAANLSGKEGSPLKIDIATFNPGSIAFALTVGSELFFITSVSILNKEHSVTLVLLNTIIAHLISNLFAVG